MPKKVSQTFVSISVFTRFSVDDSRKRILKYAITNEKGLVWTGGKKFEKSLPVLAKIFGFVGVEKKTNTSTPQDIALPQNKW